MSKDKSKDAHPWFAELGNIPVPEVLLDQHKVGLSKMQMDALKVRALIGINEKLGELLVHLKGGK